MANQQYQNNGGETREKYRLEVEPGEFGGTMKTELTTTNNLTKVIYDLFSGVNNDFEGCALDVNPMNNQLQLTLYFKEKPVNPNKLKNLVNIANNVAGRNAKPMDRITSMNIRQQNRVYELSEETKEMLEEFIDAPVQKDGSRKINWRQVAFEKTERNQYAGNSIYVAVTGLNLNRVLKKMYGGKNEDGDRVDYNTTIIAPITNNFSSQTQNFLISIIQLNDKAVQNLCKEIGFATNQSSIPMFRG